MVTQDNRAGSSARPGQGQDPHRSLHSPAGAAGGEHPGRSRDPVVKVAGLAWLEFDKPDLEEAERFATDFGFTVADRKLMTTRLARTEPDQARRGDQPPALERAR
jgi:hypothetical protein